LPDQTDKFSLVRLLESPRARKTAIERERAARRGAPGWLGITRRDDTQAALDLNSAEVFAIDVHPRSLAYRAGLRGGFLMQDGIHVEGHVIPLQNFDGAKFPAGTEVGVNYFDPHQSGRHAGDLLSTYFKLSRWPRLRPWEAQPRVANGPRVMKRERAAFLSKMRPYLRQAITSPRNGTRGERRTAWMPAFCFLSYLVLDCDNDEHAGVWPAHAESARALGLSVRTVNDLAQMLCHFGVLKRLELPTRGRNSNLYEITQPLCHKPGPRSAPVPPPPTPPRPQTKIVRL
jgi:hypothetical protein